MKMLSNYKNCYRKQRKINKECLYVHRFQRNYIGAVSDSFGETRTIRNEVAYQDTLFESTYDKVDRRFRTRINIYANRIALGLFGKILKGFLYY